MFFQVERLVALRDEKICSINFSFTVGDYTDVPGIELGPLK
jgi:hypothetical protein